MSVDAAVKKSNQGMLCSLNFDGFFVFGIAGIAILSGFVVHLEPLLFTFVIFLDLWLLGYHHVISTYTRLAFDKVSFHENRFFIFGLPLLVIAGVVLLTRIGSWTVPTVYLHWQLYHYLRQSEGVSKSYLRKSEYGEIGNPTINYACFYFLPITAFLTMSARAPETFLGLPVWTFVFPEMVIIVFQVIATIVFIAWLIPQVQALKNGEHSLFYFGYMASHYLIFVFPYLVFTHINHSWLTINVWHNAQYIAFVWFFNTNRYKKGVDPERKFISYLSQSNRFLLYFLVCFSISSGVYVLLKLIIAEVKPLTMIPLTIVVYQTINFHHYIVDSQIWKLRDKRVRRNLGLQ